MFLDIEGVSEGDYRPSGFPLENFTESKTFLFNLSFYLCSAFCEVYRNFSWSWLILSLLEGADYKNRKCLFME